MAFGGDPQADHYEKAETNPEVKADHILARIWNRKDEDPGLQHGEALHLLLYGKDAGHQLIEEEIENGRYTPDKDVQALLDKGETPPEMTVH